MRLQRSQFLLNMDCCKQRRQKDACLKSRSFENGTIVSGYDSVQECLKQMCDAYESSRNNYWATMIKNNMYEVQFTPNVKIIVGAESGYQAGALARISLLQDFMELSKSLNK